VCALCNTASLQLQRQLAVGFWKKWSGKINSVLIGMLCCSYVGVFQPRRERREWEAPQLGYHSSQRAAYVWIFHQENQNLYALPALRSALLLAPERSTPAHIRISGPLTHIFIARGCRSGGMTHALAHTHGIRCICCNRLDWGQQCALLGKGATFMAALESRGLDALAACATLLCSEMHIFSQTTCQMCSYCWCKIIGTFSSDPKLFRRKLRVL